MFRLLLKVNEKYWRSYMSKKYYAVKKGKKPGIYRTWEDAKSQVHGYPNAVYKSFKTKNEAEAFMEDSSPNNHSNNQKNTETNSSKIKTDPDTIEAYVDGSFHKASKRYSFGAVLLKDGEVVDTLQRAGDNPRYQDSWQIAGEVVGTLQDRKSVVWGRCV